MDLVNKDLKASSSHLYQHQPLCQGDSGSVAIWLSSNLPPPPPQVSQGQEVHERETSGAETAKIGRENNWVEENAANSEDN